MTTRCGATTTVEVYDVEGACKWVVPFGSQTFIAGELAVHERGTLTATDVVRATWTDAPAWFMARLVGQGAGGAGLAGVKGASVAQVICTDDRPSDCAPRPFREIKHGYYNTTLDPGRYVLIVAAFGAAAAAINVTLQMDVDFSIARLGTGLTSLLDITTDLPNETAGARSFELDGASWMAVRTADWESLASVVIEGDGGPAWRFDPHPGFPVWRSPESWGRPLTAFPNAAMGPGGVTVSADWEVAADAPGALPVIGVAHNPFFVAADGTLAEIGPPT